MGLVSEYPLWGPELVRLYVSYGSTQRALALSAALKEAADRMRVPYARGAALLAEGLIKDNLEMLLAAVDAYAKSPRLSIWRGPEKMPPLS